MPPARPLDVDYVPSAVALVRRQVFERVGLFDEDYFFGFEMADLCHRARLLGFRSVIDTCARAQHDLDRSLRLRETLRACDRKGPRQTRDHVLQLDPPCTE